MNYFRILLKIAKEPSLLNPNIIRKDIKGLDFKYLSDIGIKYIVYDKDNTITKTYNSEYFDSNIEKTIKDCLDSYTQNSIGLLSNSYRNSKVTLFQNNLCFIPTENKKPFNFEDIRKFFKTKNNQEVLVIGDRILTDVLMANMNGALSLYVKPLERSHEKNNIKIIRYFEEFILKYFFKKRRINILFSSEKLKILEK